jgi:tRNA (guanine-N7-)-methyltransferase
VTLRESSLDDAPATCGRAGLSSTAAALAHAADRTVRVEALRGLLRGMQTASSAQGGWTLDLGCGHGHFLTAFAARHPSAWCLGVDFSRDRIRRAERKLGRARLRNLFFLHAEAGEFLDALPEGFHFRQVFVLFPDPWPKRRHRKHRLVSREFLDRVGGVGAPGCGLYFRSDALDYVEEVRVAVARHQRWRLVPGADLPFETETVFQAKAAQYQSLLAELIS